jgi:AbrB family looped-hinge helix DNA binding protein
MRTTIDSAGRLVIPREARRLARLDTATEVELRVVDGRIEIEAVPTPVKLVREGRLLVARPEARTGTLRGVTVEATREGLRRDRER